MEAVWRGQGKAPGGGRWATGRLGLLGGELRAGGRGSVSGENVWLRSGSGEARPAPWQARSESSVI